MIELKNISKQYYLNGKTISALKNINLSIQEQEIFGIIGQSGAGKSTLLRCINFLEQPSQGEVIISQQNLANLNKSELNQLRHQIGMIFQHFNLLSSKSVFDNIALPLRLIGTSKLEIKKRVDELLEIVHLKDKKLAYPHQLSGGQKQRVAIARALATKPSLLLCDEATSALDPKTTKNILHLLKQIKEEYRLTIVMITHQMEVIKQICDKVAVLHQGELIENASCYEFFSHPKSELGKQLVYSTLKEELPEELQIRLHQTPQNNSKTVLRIFFRGENTHHPIVSHLIKEIGIDLNILQAHIELIQQQSLGILIVSSDASVEQIAKAQQYLKSMQIDSEIMGYVI